MKHRSLYAVALLSASAVLFSLGVYKKMHHVVKKEILIAVVPASTDNMWWEAVHAGALKAAEENGVKITWTGAEKETDREKQIQIVEDAISRRADAVVLGPNDFRALVRPVENVKAHGIPCIIIDAPVDTDRYDSFVATDNYAGGVTAARRLGAALGGHGKVLVVRFHQNSASTEARGNGFRDTIAKEFPGIRIVSEFYTIEGTAEAARQRTVDMLTRDKDIRGIFAVNQPTSIGACKAIENQHMGGRIRFVAFDSDPVLLEGVSKGNVEAIITQNPTEIGYGGVRQAVRKIRGETVERKISVPIMIVDRKNLEEMKVKYPAALGI